MPRKQFIAVLALTVLVQLAIWVALALADGGGR